MNVTARSWLLGHFRVTPFVFPTSIPYHDNHGSACGRGMYARPVPSCAVCLIKCLMRALGIPACCKRERPLCILMKGSSFQCAHSCAQSIVWKLPAHVKAHQLQCGSFAHLPLNTWDSCMV